MLLSGDNSKYYEKLGGANFRPRISCVETFERHIHGE